MSRLGPQQGRGCLGAWEVPEQGSKGGVWKGPASTTARTAPGWPGSHLWTFHFPQGPQKSVWWHPDKSWVTSPGQFMVQVPQKSRLVIH